LHQGASSGALGLLLRKHKRRAKKIWIWQKRGLLRLNNEFMEVIMENHITTGSVLDDLGFSESEAENLKIRASLMRAIEKYINEKKLTQAEAAKMMHVSQPRISDLKRGKIERFTIDMLVNMLACTHASISLIVNDQIAA